MPRVYLLHPQVFDGTYHNTHRASHLTILLDETADANTTHVMEYILDKEDAQLVILNGDLISGEATHSSNSSDYLSKIVSPLVSAGRLWASTYGNHDSEVNLDPMQDIYEQERQYSNSLTQRSIATSKAGVTNYYLPVYSDGASQDDPPILILWFFDSKGGHYAKNRLDDGRSGTRGDWVDESVCLPNYPFLTAIERVKINSNPGC